MNPIAPRSNRSIFITYNPESALEQTLAVRLYTIGQVNGFEMYLPDRFNGLTNLVDRETAFRISNSTWFICFSTQRLSSTVLREIEYAYKVKGDPSKILVIYDVSRFRTPESTGHFTAYSFDPRQNTVDQVIEAFLKAIDVANRQKAEVDRLRHRGEKAENERNALAAFLGIGIGLLALTVLGGEEPERTTGKSGTKKAATTTKKAATKKAAKKQPKKG